MNKRIFVGLAPSPSLSLVFDQYAQNYREHPGIRLVDPENFHITLCFIGDIPEEILDNVLATVQFICHRHKSFDLSFNRFSLSPAARDARMIWAKYLVGRAFSELSLDLCQIFKNLNIPHKAHQNRIPHVTLARFPQGKAPKLIVQPIPEPTLICKEVYVWQSVIVDAQRVYQPIKSFRLK